MKTNINKCLAVCAGLMAFTCTAQEIQVTIPLDTFTVRPWVESRPDGHEPAAVMGSHVHDNGVWMIAYRYTNMRMEDNITGSSPVDDTEILSNYSMSPGSMSMQMHMLGLMYGATPKLTLMLMSNYQQKRMTTVSMSGKEGLSTQSDGMGDMSMNVLYNLAEWQHNKLVGSAGLSLPLGSISMRTEMPVGQGMKMPYAMQNGSGTFDLLSKITFVSQSNHLSAGIQGNSIIRTGANKAGYRFGNRYACTSWLSAKVNPWISTSARIEGVAERSISGSDSEIMTMMSPAANPANYGGEWLRIYPGINLYVPEGLLNNARLNMEFGIPLGQSVNGIQMAGRYALMITLQWQTI